MWVSGGAITKALPSFSSSESRFTERLYASGRFSKFSTSFGYLRYIALIRGSVFSCFFTYPRGLVRITITLSQPSEIAFSKGIESVSPPSIYFLPSISMGLKRMGRAQLARRPIKSMSSRGSSIYSALPLSMSVSTAMQLPLYSVKAFTSNGTSFCGISPKTKSRL